MVKIFKLLLVFSLFFAIMPVVAKEKPAQNMVEVTKTLNISENAVLTLEDCVNLALANSPQVKKYRDYVKISKSRLGQARSDYFPTLQAGTGFNYNGDYPSVGNTTSTGLYDASATLKQLVYNFGKTGAKINMQKFYLIASEYDLSDITLKTIFLVRTNYYAVLAAKANVDVQTAYVQINERQYQRTKAYFEEGLKSKIDLVNAEVYLSDSKINLLSAKNVYENALISLNNSMYLGDSPNYKIQNTESFNLKSNLTPISLKNISTKDTYKLPEMEKGAVYTTSVEKNEILQNFEFKPFPYTFEESVELARKNRPDLKSLNATYSAMQQSLKAVKREYAPAINIGASYKFSDSSELYRNGLTAGASLDFPLINGMNTKYRIDEAKANLDVALSSIEMANQDIFFQVQKAYVDMKKLEKQIPLQHVKVRQTLENFQLADGRYEVGLGNFIELQDAKVNYNKAQQAYVEVIYNYNVARANLELKMAIIPAEMNLIEGTK